MRLVMTWTGGNEAVMTWTGGNVAGDDMDTQGPLYKHLLGNLPSSSLNLPPGISCPFSTDMQLTNTPLNTS